MRPLPRRLLAALAGAAALAAVPAVATAQEELTGVGGHLACVAPDDAAGIDGVLDRAGSPLAGEGATFVREGGKAGLDPRFLVAVAAHETLLQTYGPADAINNAFGLGPGIEFPSERAAIARAARTLSLFYVAEGRVTVGAIGSKWAPVGASNDPTGLNRHWEEGVGRYYAALGGDPSRPVLAEAQDARPDCAGEGTEALDEPVEEPEADGPPVVRAWDGEPPAIAGASAADGADPVTGEPAILEGFVFPLALPQGAPASYADGFSEPGPVACDGDDLRCAVTIESAPGAPAVAVVAGTLRVASPAEQEEGLAFWVETGAGDRVGYGPLARYRDGVRDGAAVGAGHALGASAGRMRLAWERGGERVNPHPLLRATRPPA